MHGLIFKTKESHRQDQSESFVIYICIYIYSICFFHNKSNEITSLWPVFVNFYIHTYICMYVYRYSLFHRDETKPTHIIEINSFLLLMQLIYKHSSPNYQHMISYWKLINTILNYVCVSWNIFNRIHFFAICDVFFFYVISSSFMWYSYDHIKSWRSSFDKLFFIITYNSFSHC
jgi:hypothetical protein